MKKPSPRRKASQRLKVRRAALADLEILVKHRRAMWEDMGIKGKAKHAKADQLYRTWARRHLKDGSLRGWVVENQDGLAVGGGSLWLQPVQPRPGYYRGVQPYLLSMYTHPDFRGLGVASRVVQEAANWTFINRYPSLRLHASEMGRGVYRNLGFVRTWEMKLVPHKPGSKKR